MPTQSPAGQRRLYFSLQRAAAVVKDLADERCRTKAGVTAAQAGTMFAVASADGITQREVARLLEQRESAVTTMVDRLMRAGFVARERSMQDRRAWALRLTPAGRDALAQVQDVLDGLNAELEDRLGGQVEDLADALEAIRRW